MRDISERLLPLYNACEALNELRNDLRERLGAANRAGNERGVSEITAQLVPCLEVRHIWHIVRANEFEVSMVPKLRTSLKLESLGEFPCAPLIRSVDRELAELFVSAGPRPSRFERDIDI